MKQREVLTHRNLSPAKLDLTQGQPRNYAMNGCQIEEAANWSTSLLPGFLPLFHQFFNSLHLSENCDYAEKSYRRQLSQSTNLLVLESQHLSSYSLSHSHSPSSVFDIMFMFENQFSSLNWEKTTLLSHYFSTKSNPYWVSKWQDCRSVSRREGYKDPDLPLPQGWGFKLYLSPLTVPRAGALIPREPSELRRVSLVLRNKDWPTSECFLYACTALGNRTDQHAQGSIIVKCYSESIRISLSIRARRALSVPGCCLRLDWDYL